MNPLEKLLVSGSDTRLTVDTLTGLNRFGCAPTPRPGVLSFGSCTAGTISPEAFRHVQVNYEMLCAAPCPERWLDGQMEALRQGLKSGLGLAETGTEIIFSPSGTDSTLQALFLARALSGGVPMDCILPAADETGTGIPMALQGRHFCDHTAAGVSVTPGTAIEGLGENTRLVSLPRRCANGVLRQPACQDQDVWDAVEASVGAGRPVLLQVMDSSKLGASVPSPECLRRIQTRFTGSVHIVVDACQMRLSLTRLHEHLAQGHLVLISGSKFFAGPAFSGALLVPAALTTVLERLGAVPPGLRDYTSRSAWPERWTALREALPPRDLSGQFLRWTAALSEMQAYFSVPAEFSNAALRRFAETTTALIERSPDVLLLEENSETEEGTRTIFPFLVRHGDRWMSYTDTVTLYHALNQDLSAALPIPLASALCHIGQPVRVPLGPGRDAGALRICADARQVSQLWSQMETGTGSAGLLLNENRSATEDLSLPIPHRLQISTILAKISLLAQNFELVSRLEAR